LCGKEPLPSVAVYKKLVYVGQAHGQDFLGESAIQQGDRPNDMPEVQASRGVGWHALLKIRLSETEFHKF